MDEYARENRIAEALSIRGMRQVDLVEKTGISKSSINSWIKQRYQPKSTPLMAMARALDVAELWLAGYDVPMERPAAQKRMDELALLVNNLRSNERLKKLCISISKLQDEQLTAIESVVAALSNINTTVE